MTGPATVIAQAEIYRLAKEAIPKVRQELYRLGCADIIEVSHHKGFLKLVYDQDIIRAGPAETLKSLRRIQSTDKTERLWPELKNSIAQDQALIARRLLLLIFSLSAALLLLILLTGPGK